MRERVDKVVMPGKEFLPIDQQTSSILIESNNQTQNRNLNFRRGLAMGILAGTAGLLAGVSSEAVENNAPEAFAEPCLIDNLLYDPCPNGGETTQTTVSPRNTYPPNNGGGGNSGGSGGSGGGNGGGVGNTTATTIPYGNRDNDGDGIINSIDNCDDISNPDQTNFDGDNDGDACDIDIDGDTYPNNGGVLFNDADDMSPGLGDQGLEQARNQNIDVDSGSEIANLNRVIAFTVNPNDWNKSISNYANYGIEVLAATTTTTTTTTEKPEEVQTTESIETEVTEVDSKEQTETTELEVVLPIDNSGNNEKNNSNVLPIGIATLSVFGLGGFLFLARRKRKENEDTETIDSISHTSTPNQTDFGGAVGN